MFSWQCCCFPGRLMSSSQPPELPPVSVANVTAMGEMFFKQQRRMLQFIFGP